MSSFPAELHSSTPPAPPPKGGSHNVSSISTPTTASSPPPPPFPRPAPNEPDGAQGISAASTPPLAFPISDPAPDPGEGWLPEVLRDKSTQALADILANPALVNSLAHAPSSSHKSTKTSHANLSAALDHNSALATQLVSAASRLSHQRSTTQAQLLSTHALERQWRQKQSDMDHALAPFSPASLYQQLSQGVQEQALVCQAMEESFLEGHGDDVPALERDVTEWVRKYREAKVQYYLRQERKERWDEGRVGGWR
ncbi:hypothetical protein QQS21_008708 [Conoideocrella luteorostrata]|uniref:VPS37 C-terminal domain-containing protein n=1 Tax=Conoideocrella luteorostrata TaxID=1105319 RepID=A0AAJ0FVQ6_9HYPO|nr:hypothetical protein QQS21_008708 [Conoideocrella luteorostrata]